MFSLAFFLIDFFWKQVLQTKTKTTKDCLHNQQNSSPVLTSQEKQFRLSYVTTVRQIGHRHFCRVFTIHARHGQYPSSQTQRYDPATRQWLLWGPYENHLGVPWHLPLDTDSVRGSTISPLRIVLLAFPPDAWSGWHPCPANQLNSEYRACPTSGTPPSGRSQD